MKIEYILDTDAHKPTKAYEYDAGFDLYSRKQVVIDKYDSATFDTGVHINIPKGYVGFLKSKSGLNVNNGITSTGVVDSGYTGSIKIKLYNNRDEPYTVYEGDKISQIVFLPIPKVWLKEVKIFKKDKHLIRGTNGFGSSGKK